MQLKRRIAVVVALATLSAVGVVLSHSPAYAHGAIMEPGSRTYLCWRDSVTNNGQALPVNPACVAAVAKNGPTSIYNWFAVLRGDGAGRTVGFIPDGKLCSGDAQLYDFSGFDLARADWPVTHLTAGGTFAWRYSNWAHHPGTFRMFITKDSWSPTRPLAWSDLQSTPFLSVTNPSQRGAIGTNTGHYYWSGKLPANKSGRHIIYTTWTRSDSQETFYNCSDVVFDGGTGQVTGIRDPAGGPSPAPTAPSPAPTAPSPAPTAPSPAPTAPSPAPTAPSPAPSPAPTTSSPGPASPADCVATYQTVNSWSGGFLGQVVLRNTGTTALTGWTVHGMFDGNQAIRHIWNATHSQTSSHVTASSMHYNRTLAAGASTTVGFLGSGPPPARMIGLMCVTP